MGMSMAATSTSVVGCGGASAVGGGGGGGGSPPLIRKAAPVPAARAIPRTAKRAGFIASPRAGDGRIAVHDGNLRGDSCNYG